jgi:hypothetical protein
MVQFHFDRRQPSRPWAPGQWCRLAFDGHGNRIDPPGGPVEVLAIGRDTATVRLPSGHLATLETCRLELLAEEVPSHAG